jgi:hypothetical protein
MTAPGLVPVRDEMLECSLLLPDGWTVTVQDTAPQLVCVAGGDLERSGYRPSITIERHPGTDPSELPGLAQRSEAFMTATYQRYTPRWSRLEQRTGRSARFLRSHEFLLDGTTIAIRQLQGLED